MFIFVSLNILYLIISSKPSSFLTNLTGFEALPHKLFAFTFSTPAACLSHFWVTLFLCLGSWLSNHAPSQFTTPSLCFSYWTSAAIALTPLFFPHSLCFALLCAVFHHHGFQFSFDISVQAIQCNSIDVR